jgi:hypothetical protein
MAKYILEASKEQELYTTRAEVLKKLNQWQNSDDQMILKSIQAHLENAVQLKTQGMPHIQKLMNLNTEEEFEEYLHACAQEKSFQEDGNEITHSHKFFRSIHFLCELQSDFHSCVKSIQEGVESLWDREAGVYRIGLPAEYNEEQLKEFLKLSNATTCVVTLLGEHLYQMETLAMYNEKNEQFLMEGTRAFQLRFGSGYSVNRHLIEDKFKIFDYVQTKEIAALSENWKKYSENSKNQFYAVRKGELVTIEVEKDLESLI